MQVTLYNLAHKEVRKIAIPERIFAQAWNADLVHQTLVVQEANARVPLAHTKTRAEVRGGGRKPWRQKGTGRARHGSIRSPLWKGGGVTFGPRKEKIFLKKINTKMRRRAIFAVLSQKLKEGELFFIADREPRSQKAQELARSLQVFFGTSAERLLPSTLVITPEKDRGLEQASSNLKRVAILRADSLNVRDLLLRRWILIQEPSIPIIEKTYVK